MATFNLGDLIEIWCRYCRLNLDGVVAALKDGEVVKVQCRTCRHFQDYKPPVPMEQQRQKLLRKAMRIAERHGKGPARMEPEKEENLSQEAVIRTLWEEATKDASSLRASVYEEYKAFKEKDVILHKAFGMGVVQEATEDAILVLFREGFQRLPHKRPRE